MFAIGGAEEGRDRCVGLRTIPLFSREKEMSMGVGSHTHNLHFRLRLRLHHL